MVAPIPNDIFQFSTLPALRACFSTASSLILGPQCAALTNHGTHGIGSFGDTGDMLLLDSVPYKLLPTGSVERTRGQERLPFAMVTIFESSTSVVIQGGLKLEQLNDVFTSRGPYAGGKNSYMPFHITGTFDSASIGSGRINGPPGFNKTPPIELHNVTGTIFGFACPPWAGEISGTGPMSLFLSNAKGGQERKGGYVVDFAMTGNVRVDWGICGRFHLGLPTGEGWEALPLGKDEASRRDHDEL